MTDLTRELERTRNGAKIMERTLEAAALRIKELEDALRGITTAWNDGSDVDVLIDRAVALLEKK